MKPKLVIREIVSPHLNADTFKPFNKAEFFAVPAIEKALLTPCRFFVLNPTEDIPKLSFAFVADKACAKVPAVPAVVSINAIFVNVFKNAFRKRLRNARRTKAYALLSVV